MCERPSYDQVSSVQCRASMVKEMNCNLSNIHRFHERLGEGDGPRSVEGRANNPMSLRSLGGQLCLPGRVPLQTFHLSFDNEPSSSLPLAFCSPVCFGNEHSSAWGFFSSFMHPLLLTFSRAPWLSLLILVVSQCSQPCLYRQTAVSVQSRNTALSLSAPFIHL